MRSPLRRLSRFVARRVVLLAALAAAVAWPLTSNDSPVRAQEAASPSPTADVRSRWTPQRLTAVMEASNQQLDYVPGEVVVKFRDGVTVEGQQRALSGVRSRRRWRICAGPAISRCFTTQVNQTRTCWPDSCGFSPKSCGLNPTTCVGHIACSRPIRASHRSNGTCARSTCRAPGTSIQEGTRPSSSRLSIRG